MIGEKVLIRYSRRIIRLFCNGAKLILNVPNGELRLIYIYCILDVYAVRNCTDKTFQVISSRKIDKFQ